MTFLRILAVTIATIAQCAALNAITLTPAEIEVGDGHAVSQILVQSTGSWTVVDEVPWVSLSRNDGEGDQNVLVSVERNTTGATRVGEVTIGGVQLVVTQRTAGSGVRDLWAMGNGISGQLGNNLVLYRTRPAFVMQDVSAIAAWGEHSLFLRADGTLLGAGFNVLGQLGDGTDVDRSVPVEISDDVVQIAAGYYTTHFVKADGTLWKTGSSPTGHSYEPILIDSNVVSVSAGGFHSFYLKTDGSLWAMGDNTYGQLGDGTKTNRTTPVQVASDVATVTAGYGFSLFVKTDGTLWAVGSNGEGQLGDGTNIDRSVPVQVATGVASVSAGSSHSLFVRTNGTLWAMGANYSGQLGNGNTNSSTTPIIIAASVAAVAAGSSHSLFVKADGTLWAMGNNTNGELGDGSLINRSTPVQIGESVASVAAALYHTLFLKNDGTVWVSGRNSRGQFGNGIRFDHSTPLHVATDVSKVSSGIRHTLFIKSDGSLWSAGSNEVGQLGDGATINRSSPVMIASDVVKAAAGGNCSLFVKSDASLWAMGSLYGSIGFGSTPTLIASDVKEIAVGQFHVLIVKTDDTLWSMGLNFDGQLGDGTTQDRSTPVQVASDVAAVAAGSMFSLFAKMDGTLWAMGQNVSGQLGDGTTTSRAIPVQIASGVSGVAAGRLYSLFVKTDGTLWATGDNTQGQLGDGTVTSRSTPVQVASDVAVAVAGLNNFEARNHSLFIKTDGTLWAMGHNRDGELGDGSRANQSTPVKIAKGVLAAAAGSMHSLFITDGPYEIPPEITIHPASDSVNAGSTANFTVLAKGSAPLDYKWFKDGVEIEGATNATLEIADADVSDAGSYWVVVSNTGGSVTSSHAVLTVQTPPLITEQPNSVTVLSGQTASFVVVASGKTPLLYQWTRNGASIPGATSATYEISEAQPSHSGFYAVVVSNLLGSQTSASAALIVNVPPSIVTGPVDLTIKEGQPAIFEAAASGSDPLAYQWRRNGEPIVGASEARFEIAAALPSDAGLYELSVNNAYGSVTSSPVSLTVNPLPKIVAQPSGMVVARGQSASFTVQATGTGSLSYLWRKDGKSIDGATTATFTIGSVEASDAGQYTVVVSDDVGQSTSMPATLTVYLPPSITAQPADATVAAGSQLTLSVTATGTNPIAYQWRKDGAAIAGEISASFVLPNAQASDSGSYSVVVSNIAGTATSNPASVAVIVPPAILVQPLGSTVVTGGSAILNVNVSGTAPFAYQWRRNGTDISGATASSLPLVNIEPLQAGEYTVVITNLAGSVTSNAATLTIDTVPRLINVSCRAFAGAGGNTLIAGFYLAGTGAKTVLIRGIGPKLLDQNVASVVADPKLFVYKADQVVGSNDDWDAALAPDFIQMGAFSLNAGSKDAALKITLEAPGAYTVHLVNEGPIAEGLIEVYDFSRDLGSRLSNVSCRLNIAAGQTAILGTYLLGSSSHVLARNSGPSLAKHLINPLEAMGDPHLRVYAGSTQIALNDDWGEGTAVYFGPVGAFPFDAGSKDAAIRVPFTPGGYTVHAASTDGGAGVVLIELYESP